MNKIESLVYNIVKSNPKLKLELRNLYQSIFDLIPDKPNYFRNKSICREGYFFGFHDISPFSFDDKLLLANKLLIPLRMPLKNDALSVGYFKGVNLDQFVEIDKTFAWNYHKGCRLQWVGDRNEIIYNCFENKLNSKIYNIIDKSFKHINWPIDSISPNGKYATSFSYERLQRVMPGYGYIHEDESFLNQDTPDSTGLFLIDIENNSRELLISLKKLANLDIESSMQNSIHYVTHTLFSPDNKYIAFLHRWIKDDVTKRWSRLIVINIDNSRLFISPTNEMVSHFVWGKDNSILAYCRINNIDSHVIFKDQTMQDYQRVAYPTLNSDGHQSFGNKDLFITDTYSDKRRYAKIFLVNKNNNSIQKIVEVKSYKKFQSKDAYKHWACDLHSRFNRRGDMVCFDSVHTGKRALCTMGIK